MEKELKDLNNYFALVNLKAFCEKYGQKYDYVRQVLSGKKPMTEKFLAAMVSQMQNFEEDQRKLARVFHYNFVTEE